MPNLAIYQPIYCIIDLSTRTRSIPKALSNVLKNYITISPFVLMDSICKTTFFATQLAQENDTRDFQAYEFPFEIR